MKYSVNTHAKIEVVPLSFKSALSFYCQLPEYTLSDLIFKQSVCFLPFEITNIFYREKQNTFKIQFTKTNFYGALIIAPAESALLIKQNIQYTPLSETEAKRMLWAELKTAWKKIWYLSPTWVSLGLTFIFSFFFFNFHNEIFSDYFQSYASESCNSICVGKIQRTYSIVFFVGTILLIQSLVPLIYLTFVIPKLKEIRFYMAAKTESILLLLVALSINFMALNTLVHSKAVAKLSVMNNILLGKLTYEEGKTELSSLKAKEKNNED